MFRIDRNKAGKGGNSWLVLILIAAALLIPQSPFSLFASLLPGTAKNVDTNLFFNDLIWDTHYDNTASSCQFQPDPCDQVSSAGAGAGVDNNVLFVSAGAGKKASGDSASANANTRANASNLLTNEEIILHVSISATASGQAQARGNAAISIGTAGLGFGFNGCRTCDKDPSGSFNGWLRIARTPSGNWDFFTKECSTCEYKYVSTVTMPADAKISLSASAASGGDSGAGTEGSGSGSVTLFDISVITSTDKLVKPSCEATGGTYKQANNGCSCPLSSKGYKSGVGCDYACAADEVKLISGDCKKLIRTCIDNNLNNICDPEEPIVYKDPDTNAPVCSDRDNNRVCDDVQSLFCQDSNKNGICDSDEVKWYATNCPDANGNGVCDGIESGKVLCPTTFSPVCDPTTNITYPNSCFAGGFNVNNTVSGACQVPPVIIRLDCTSGKFPIPSGYLCQPETGFLYRIDKIYQNTTLDCRSLPATEGYTCQQIGDTWVFTKTEVKNIDCLSRGCPTNSLCQGGICVTSQLKCPTDVNCAATYGANSVCDSLIGLCVKQQYYTTDCSTFGCPSGNTCVSQNSTHVCIQSSLKEPIAAVPVFGNPKSGGIFKFLLYGVGVIAAILVVSKLKK